MRQVFILLLIVLFSIPTIGVSENENKVSLLSEKFNQLGSIKDIDSLLNSRLEIIKTAKDIDFILFVDLSNQQLELAKKENRSYAQIDVLMELGSAYVERGVYGLALNHLNGALKLAQMDEYKPYEGWVALEIGNCYEAMFNYSRAIDFFKIALNVFENTGEKDGVALASTNIGTGYNYLKEFNKAESFLKRGVEVRKELGDPVELGYAELYFSQMYLENGEVFVAKENLLELNSNLKNLIKNQNPENDVYALSQVLGDALCLLAVCNDSLDLSRQKYDYLFEAAELFKELNDELNLSTVYNIISDNFLQDEQLLKAKKYAESARQIAQEGMVLNQQAYANAILSGIYETLGDYELALQYQKEYQLLNDSMYNQSVIDAIADVDVLIETIANQKDKQILQARIDSEKMVRRILFIGVGVFLIMLMALMLEISKRYKKRKELNERLMVKNTKIIDQKEKLQKLNEDLETLVKSKDKFHSIIAHDLINPVGAIYNVVDLLNSSYDEIPEDERKELIELTSTTSKDTLNLLQNLLTWSRIQGGHLKVKKECFLINRKVEEVVGNLKHLAEVKSINVKVENSNEIEVLADSEMISTVVRNLFSNAVKYSNSGNEIEIGIQKSGEWVEVWVKDQGIGIPEDKVKELFTIDSQIQRPGTNNESGTGLGLQLANEFVKLHNGFFKVESKVLEGSRFTFSIPFKLSEN